jgi:predicted amidohydrolase
MSTLTVSIVQTELHWHDAERNLARFSRILAQRETEPDLIVLPEMFTTGFTMHARENAERMDGSSVAWMKEEAANASAALCGSLIIEVDGEYYNRFIVAHPNGFVEHYDKRHLFRLAGEHEHYSCGTKPCTFSLKGWRIRPMVCYDLRFPVWSRNRDDYDLLVYVANWPDRRHLAWEILIRARAIENLAYVAAVNRIGTDGNDIRYAGGSAILNYMGQDVAALSSEPGITTASLDMADMTKFRQQFPFHLDADEFSLLSAGDRRIALP